MTDRLAALALGICLLFAVGTDFVGGWTVYAFQAGVLLTTAAWLIAADTAGTPIHWHMLFIPLALLALAGPMQLATGFTIYRFATVRETLSWTAAAAVFFLALQLLGRRPIREALLEGLPWFGAALATVAGLGLMTSTGRAFWLFETGYEDYVLGPFVNRNHYAALMALLFPLAVVRAFGNPTWRVPYAAITGLMFATVAAAASRAGVLLLAAELLFLLAVFGRRRSGWKTAVAVLGVVVLSIGLLGAATVWDRLRDPASAEFRIELSRITLDMIGERPGTGFGLGTWPEVYPEHAVRDVGRFINHAHNDWLEWAADGGIPVLVCWLAVAVASLALAAREPWGIGVPAVFLHSLFDYPLRKPAIAGLALVLLAAMIAARNDSPTPGVDRTRSRRPT